MTTESANAATRKTQNVYRAGRTGAAWSGSEAARPRSGTSASIRTTASATKPLRLKALKHAS